MYRQLQSFLISIIVLLLWYCPSPQATSGELPKTGEPLPKLTTAYELSSEERAYLDLYKGEKKLPFFRKREFSLHDINAEVLVVEFLNRYCPSCQAQAPIFNSIFERILEHQDLAQTVKFIGIGAGNDSEEVKKYRREKEIPFPVIPDPDFSLYDTIGDPGAIPFTLIVKKTDTDSAIAFVHVGVMRDPDVFIKEIHSTLERSIADIRIMTQQEMLVETEDRKFSLAMSEEELYQKVQKSMRSALTGNTTALNVSKLSLPETGTLYRGEAITGGKDMVLFSKIISRKPVCDVCHGIHFIVTFGTKGIIEDFLPIYLTKYGNVEWHAKDMEFMQKKILDTSLKKEYKFKPEVDAVSLATMTSAIIFNSLHRMKAVLEELKQHDML